MMLKALNVTVGVLVAATVCSYAVAVTYVVARGALLFYHLMQS